MLYWSDKYMIESKSKRKQSLWTNHFFKPERLWQVAVSSSLLCCRCRRASRSCCMAAMRQDSMPCPTEKHVQSASCWDVVFCFFVCLLFFAFLTCFFPACFPSLESQVWANYGIYKMQPLSQVCHVPLQQPQGPCHDQRGSAKPQPDSLLLDGMPKAEVSSWLSIWSTLLVACNLTCILLYSYIWHMLRYATCVCI